jgi:hypothetical protein
MSDALRAAHGVAGGRVWRCAAMAAAACLGAHASADNHLLITEVKGAGSDFIEIWNPTQSAVDLTNYYLSDSVRYSRIACCITDLSLTSDFIARFPSGSSIPAGGLITVAMSANAHLAAYGSNPTFEMPSNDPKDPGSPVPDMLDPWGNGIGAAKEISDGGEWIFLFYWDQQSDLVKDVDIIRVGIIRGSDGWVGKNTECWDGPDMDITCSTYNTTPDAMSQQGMQSSAPSTHSYKRLYKEGALENHCAGNGLTAHDETSENNALTWDGHGVAYTAPTPGSIPLISNPPGFCFADITGNNVVNTDDLLLVIGGWGACTNGCGSCPADIAPVGCLNCSVNTDDLIALITSWGACP